MRIFLSYNSTDRDLADRIRLALLARKHTVFFDRNDLPPGLSFDARIAQAVDEADLFVFLISPESITEGRYTLTELGLAQRKWSHPDRHVLPVMVRAVPIEQIPPYLKAVTIMKPSGDIPAEVTEEIDRIAPHWWRRRRWVIGGVAAAAVAGLLFIVPGMGSHARQVADLLQAAQSLEAAGEYSSAWTKTEEARSRLSGSALASFFQRTLVHGVQTRQGELASAWLDHMRLREGERFSDVVSRLLPSLDEAIAATEGERKADFLAHRGWADFLRSRDSGQQFTPESYYRQALEIDPANVYAHAMWGHWILWRHGDLDDAREHFNAALASGRERPYVRGMQLIAMRNRRGDDTDAEMLRIVHDMMIHKESLTEQTQSDIRSIYYFACGRESTGHMEKLSKSLPVEDHIELLRGLFFGTDQSDTRTIPQHLCLARLEEQAGLRDDALKTYRALQKRLTPHDAIWPLTKTAVARLSSMK